MAYSRVQQRFKRKRRIRKKISGSPEKPRLSVYKSSRYVYAQLIDDLNGRTLCAASSLSQKKGGANKMAGQKVGAEIAEKAKSLKIGQVTFDRNGFLYHGVIKSVADEARKSGLKF